ncbi:MAG: V-type ATPase subunit [Brevinema sp.]
MISVQYIPLSVRVRAWSVSLFSKNDLVDLIHTDLPTLMSHITQKETKISLTTDDQTIFIQSLRQSLSYYLGVATRLTTAEGKHFITELEREYEIDNLKLLARMISSGKRYGQFMHVNFFSAISEQHLLDTRTFHDFINLLSGTIYENLIPALQKTEQEKNTLFWETALDNFYFARLLTAVKRLDHQSRLFAKKIWLLPIQCDQLVTIYRYRFHYNVDPSEVLMLVPNIFHLLNFDQWKRIIYSVTPSDFMSYIQEIYHIDTHEIIDASQLRILFRRKNEQICRQQLHKGMTEISSFLAFYQLKKIQLQTILTIIESKSMLDMTDINLDKFL